MITSKTIEEFEIDLILEDLSNQDNHFDLIMMSVGGLKKTKQSFMDYINSEWEVFALYKDQIFIGTFGIRLNEGIQLSRAYILSEFRNSPYEGKPYIEHLTIEAIQKGKDLYPDESRVWGVVYNITASGNTRLNRGYSSYLKVGFKKTAETNIIRGVTTFNKIILEL